MPQQTWRAKPEQPSTASLPDLARQWTRFALGPLGPDLAVFRPSTASALVFLFVTRQCLPD
jgi:hypothetical protein